MVTGGGKRVAAADPALPDTLSVLTPMQPPGRPLMNDSITILRKGITIACGSTREDCKGWRWGHPFYRPQEGNLFPLRWLHEGMTCKIIAYSHVCLPLSVRNRCSYLVSGVATSHRRRGPHDDTKRQTVGGRATDDARRFFLLFFNSDDDAWTGRFLPF